MKSQKLKSILINGSVCFYLPITPSIDDIPQQLYIFGIWAGIFKDPAKKRRLFKPGKSQAYSWYFYKSTTKT